MIKGKSGRITINGIELPCTDWSIEMLQKSRYQDARVVCWDAGNGLVLEMKAEDAVQEQLSNPEGVKYSRGVDALKDFMSSHRAWFKKIQLFRPYHSERTRDSWRENGVSQ